MLTKKITTTILLLAFSLFASWFIYFVGPKYKIIVSMLILISIVAIAVLLKVTPREMGIEISTLKQGLLLALPLSITVIAVMGVIYLARPATFLDSRYNQDIGSMLYSILVILPLTTVLLEELFFRGLFLGYLLNVSSTLIAMTISSIAFGLWHFYTSKNVTITGIADSNILVSVGVVFATAVAGIFFSWLRIRGNNLITPIIIHWTINATGVVLSFMAWRYK